MSVLQRLHEAVAAVCPIHGVSGVQGSIVVHYTGAATQPQKDAADAVVVAFDWSQGTHDIWLAQQQGATVGNITPVRLAANVSSTVTALGDVTGLSFQLKPNSHYAFEFVGAYTTAVGTTGLSLAVNGPASPVLVRGVCQIHESATAVRGGTMPAFNAAATGANSGGATALPFFVKGNVSTGPTGGVFTLRFASEVGGSQVTIQSGSYGLLYGISG